MKKADEYIKAYKAAEKAKVDGDMKLYEELSEEAADLYSELSPVEIMFGEWEDLGVI